MCNISRAPICGIGYLTSFRRPVFQPEHAEIGAAVLVRTNLRGIDTHGVTRVLDYIEKLRSGEINASGGT